MRRAAPALALMLLVCACSGGATTGVVSPSGQPSAILPRTPTASPTAAPVVPVFDAARALRTVQALATGIGPRDAASASYRRAAELVAASFTAHGYTVRRQTVGVPAGSSAGRSVPAGETQNVIATPPGYDPAAPHLLVGAHLDSVPGAPGGNDNASGIAVMMELARLARLAPTRMPIVWVAFGGEERRVPGDAGALFGSRAYLDAMPQAEHASLKGVLVMDVVGRGPEIQIVSDGSTAPSVREALNAAATRLGIRARMRIFRELFSDHRPFERDGFPVGWLYTGEFDELHTRRDTAAIVDVDALRRTGRIAWETVRTLSL